MEKRNAKFEKGDKVRVCSEYASPSPSPYEGCVGVVGNVIREENGFLYVVQFGRSGDLALTDNFMEVDLQNVGK